MEQTTEDKTSKSLAFAELHPYNPLTGIYAEPSSSGEVCILGPANVNGKSTSCIVHARHQESGDIG
jgi:hypothetical protein